MLSLLFTYFIICMSFVEQFSNNLCEGYSDINHPASELGKPFCGAISFLE